MVKAPRAAPTFFQGGAVQVLLADSFALIDDLRLTRATCKKPLSLLPETPAAFTFSANALRLQLGILVHVHSVLRSGGDFLVSALYEHPHIPEHNRRRHGDRAVVRRSSADAGVGQVDSVAPDIHHIVDLELQIAAPAFSRCGVGE